MKQLSTQAIILKRVNFGEADRILQVISSDQGRLSLLAKGVRRSKSKLAGGLELFSVSDITFIDGKSDIKTVISARLKTHFRNIVLDIDRTGAAYDFLKSVDEYTQHGSEPGYYDVLQKSLAALDDSDVGPSVVYLWFVMQVMTLIGSGINLEKPLKASKFSEAKKYNLSFEDMALYEHDSGIISGNHIKLMKLAEKLANPKSLNRVVDAEDLCKDLQKLMLQLLKINRA